MTALPLLLVCIPRHVNPRYFLDGRAKRDRHRFVLISEMESANEQGIDINKRKRNTNY
jgi:hypothetical protein